MMGWRAESDIIIEGFRPGAVDRLELGYEDIKKVKPDMIYCSISGFGQEGPYRDMPGHDVNYLALSGYFSIPGQAGTPPSRPGIPIVDLCAGGMATTSILAALLVRERNGEGQYIDIAMLDAITAWTSLRAGAYLVKGEAITDEHVMATNGVFLTRDNKLVALGIVNEDHFWRNFCNTAGQRALGEDPLFGTVEGRHKNRQALSEILKTVFRERTELEWRELFKDSDVPLCPVATLEEALADPQIVHRQMVKSISDPARGEIKIAGFPAKFSGIATDIPSPPPRAGEHTRELLGQLGYPEGVISALETTK